jgi:hypothetical protein
MNRRHLLAILALAFAPTLAACGSDDEAPAQATTLQLSGVYRPVDQGPIGSITFSGSQDYLLMPKGCAGGGCAELGTYRLDTVSHALVLENGATHQTRSIALEILETTPAGGTLVKGVAPLDLVDPGEQLTRPGQQTTNGQQQVTPGNGGQQLAQSGSGITGAVTQLLQLIQQAMMNGQQMKRDDANAKPPADPPPADPKAAPKNDPNVDCKQGIPNKNSPVDEVAAYFARCPAGP